jgi:hypothetical protein
LDQRGVHHDQDFTSTSIYCEETLLLAASIHSHEISLPWQPPRRARTSCTPAPIPRKKKGQGAASRKGSHRPSRRRCLPWPPPRGFSSPSPQRAAPPHQNPKHHLHLPLFNLLANMMCIAIYHFSMIYCVSMSLFE